MLSLFFFFFNDTATTEIYTLSLHDALPISVDQQRAVSHLREGQSQIGRDEGLAVAAPRAGDCDEHRPGSTVGDRKSTRLNSSHLVISYAVFCLKKKKTPPTQPLSQAG